MKRALKTIKFLFVFSAWTVITLTVFRLVLSFFWNFDILNAKSWHIVGRFWENGGKINSWQDYLFFFLLFSFFPIWIWGIYRGMKADFLQLALKPVLFFMNRGLDEAPKNVTIKNIDVTVKKQSKEEVLEKIIGDKMKALEKDEPETKTYDDMRKSLAQKK